MTKLTGTEKQVAWAEDIINSYKKTLATLKGALALVQDLTQIEVVDHDPLFGDETRCEYTSNLTTGHQAAITTATYWAPKSDKGHSGSWVVSRSIELTKAGENHPDRKAQAESLAMTIKSLENALNIETEAKYWIDHR